jgi:hypothetical protein
MTDQELIFSALRQVGFIVAKHLEGTGDADEAITQLIAALDTRQLADAMNRVERGYGLRVVKWRHSAPQSMSLDNKAVYFAQPV